MLRRNIVSCLVDVYIICTLSLATNAYAVEFLQPTLFELSETSPSDIVLGDFNNDGFGDMVVSMSGESGGVGSVSILLGNGVGGFPTHNGLATGIDGLGYAPLGIGSGDFNEDGNLDLVVTAGGAGSTEVHIYQGNGTGSFSFSITVNSGAQSPGSVVTGDFNNDDNIDIAIGNTIGVGPGVSVFLGTGTGSFSVAQNIVDTASTSVKDITAADFDHDGDLDIITPLAVLLNNGSAGFTRAANVGVSNPRAVAVSDMDKDGWLDVVVLGKSSVAVWKNNKDGTFSVAHFYSSPGGNPSLRGISIADFNLDSIPDVAFADELNDEINLLIGTGNGVLAAPQTLLTGNEPWVVAVADWDADNYPDIATADRNAGGVPFTDIHLQKIPLITPPAGDMQFSAVSQSQAEDTGIIVLAVNRVGGSFGNVSVDYASRDGAAVAGSDFVAALGTLNFTSGETRQTIAVQVLDDTNFEGDESFYLDLSNALGGANLGATLSTEVLILDNEFPGTLQFDSSTYSVNENILTASITVNRIGGSSGEVTVDIVTGDETAIAGSDYTGVNGVISFAEGVTSQTFDITILDDSIAEVDETFIATLNNPSGGATLGSPINTSILILRNDQPGSLQFSAPTYSVAENGVTASITVTRVGGSFGVVGVDYASGDNTATAGSDYTAVSGSLVFADGVLSQSFSVSIADDVIYEGNESINLSLSNPSGGAGLGSPTVSVLTINEDDPDINLPPVITAPPDISITSHGILTNVELGSSTAIDDKDGLLIALPNQIEPFFPGHHEILWEAVDSSGNKGFAIQVLDIKPLVEFLPDQLAAPGAVAKIRIVLNGNAVAYPVEVNYEVFLGDNVVADSNGVITINSGTEGSFDYAIPSGFNSGNIIFKINSVANVAIGAKAIHKVSVITENVPPLVDLEIRQNGILTRMVTIDGGLISIKALTNDTNILDNHTYDWSNSDNVLLALVSGIASPDFQIDPLSLSSGFYKISVRVTDDGISNLETTIATSLQVLDTKPVLTNIDSDGDGVDDLTEGIGDSDNDGISNYQDAVNKVEVMQGKSGIFNKWLLNTQAGLSIRLGSISLLAGRQTANVTKQEIVQYTNMFGGAVPANAEDAQTNVGGYFDFEVHDLTYVGQSILIVIPQHNAIPDSAVYRKYTTLNGWKNFVLDTRNSLASAPGELGVCPSPGAAEYILGLHTGFYCIQLMIEDGGPNDADNRNAVIKDPSGVATSTIPALIGSGGSGGGSISLVSLLFLFGVYSYRSRRVII